MWILRVSNGATKRATFRLSPGTVKTIGRAKGANIILDAALVSRVHCRLEAGEDGVAVSDLSSTNGTFVNDKRVERAVLSVGDKLRVGRVELLLERSAGQAKLER
jgi:pSer/pThr/pTyr-binding forkhead associated (FHA) protein